VLAAIDHGIASSLPRHLVQLLLVQLHTDETHDAFSIYSENVSANG
jgi:hypothetical protein